MGWEEVADKVRALILEKKPKQLDVTVYKGEVYIYIEGALECKLPLEAGSKPGESNKKKSKNKSK